jgi:hypothetical protein
MATAVGLLVAEARNRRGEQDEARKLLTLIRANLLGSRNPTVLSDVRDRLAGIEADAIESDRYRAAAERLKTAPNDPAANLAAGRYLYLVRGDATNGLPLLSKGSDAALQKAALAELARPATPEQQKEAGDLWWEQSAKEAKGSSAGKQCKALAGAWYSAAEPRLTGLVKATVRQRLETMQVARADAPRLDAPRSDAPRSDGASSVHLTNKTEAAEGQKIAEDIQARFPNVLPLNSTLELVKAYDAIKLRRAAGGPTKRDGSYSPQPVVGTFGGIWLWGIKEPLPTGSYLAVYRLASTSELKGSRVCVLDICVNDGQSIASRRPDAEELPLGEWKCVPVRFKLTEGKVVEYRLWPQNHEFAVDRIYVFRMVDDK